MKVGKVIGNIWATRKEDKLAGLKLMIVQPVSLTTGEAYGTPLVASPLFLQSKPVFCKSRSRTEDNCSTRGKENKICLQKGSFHA